MKGKPTTLRCIQALYGIPTIFTQGTTVTSILSQSSSTNCPMCKNTLIMCIYYKSMQIFMHEVIDDIKSKKKLEELAVENFNGFAMKIMQ